MLPRLAVLGLRASGYDAALVKEAAGPLLMAAACFLVREVDDGLSGAG